MCSGVFEEDIVFYDNMIMFCFLLEEDNYFFICICEIWNVIRRCDKIVGVICNNSVRFK